MDGYGVKLGRLARLVASLAILAMVYRETGFWTLMVLMLVLARFEIEDRIPSGWTKDSDGV